MRGQVIAITLVVACGIMAFVSMRLTYLSLVQSQDTYYTRYPVRRRVRQPQTGAGVGRGQNRTDPGCFKGPFPDRNEREPGRSRPE